MTMLASLVRAYERMSDAPPFGFAVAKVSFCLVLRSDGAVEEVIDLRDTDKKRTPMQLLVPQPAKRTVGIDPNFLWDKSSYVLGVTSERDIAPRGEDTPDQAASRAKDRAKRLTRVADEHAAFRGKHAEWLQETQDEGLLAFSRFLINWTPDSFAAPPFSAEMLDQNIVFRLSEERSFLHERPAAKAIWALVGAQGVSKPQICLVTGNPAPVARLHPSVKGVWGAQSSGASLVSFNLDAFASYGHDQGDNAPVSEAAAFAYGTALNRYLDRDSKNRIQIGDASTVFWADAEAQRAEMAEAFFAAYADPSATERIAENKLQAHLDGIRKGRPLHEVLPNLEGVRFCILGLAPNAARLSVRFWWENDFGTLTANYQRYLEDTRIEPPPRDGWPPLWRYLLELAVQGKRENVPPLIAGEWMRAILTGSSYPLSLLSSVLMRLRADGDVNALRAAILKSVLTRNFAQEVPVALDPENTNKGYILGRLFAVYEEVQRAALGNKVNATIKDKFYGAASSSPQKVFRALDSGAQNHFTKLRKESPGRAFNLEKRIMAITDLMSPEQDPIPAALSAQEQALFGIGYYHQRSDFFRKSETTPNPEASE
jgi:CRISPR-associated protein Csd1